jgi:hypothetical protein
MEIKVVDQGGVELVPEVQREITEPDTTPIKTGEYLVQTVGQMFDLKPSEAGAYKDKINLLLDYARTQTSDTSPEGLKWAIRALQGKVGTPPLGERWINYLSKYAYIKLEGLKLAKDVEKYEHGNH